MTSLSNRPLPGRAAAPRSSIMLTASSADLNRIGSWAYNVVAHRLCLRAHRLDRVDRGGHGGGLDPADRVLRLCRGAGANRFERTRTLLVSTLAALVLTAAIALVMAASGPIAADLAAGRGDLGRGHRIPAGVRGADPRDGARPGPGRRQRPVRQMPENLVVIVGPAIGGLLLLAGRPARASASTWTSCCGGRPGAQDAGPQLRAGAWPRRAPGAPDRGRGPGAAAPPPAGLVVAFCVLGTAVYGASTVLYVPMSQRFGTGADGYSYLLTAAAIGGVLGAVGASRLAAAFPLPAVIGGGMLSLALPFAATTLTTSAAAGFILQVISGGGMAVMTSWRWPPSSATCPATCSAGSWGSWSRPASRRHGHELRGRGPYPLGRPVRRPADRRSRLLRPGPGLRPLALSGSRPAPVRRHAQPATSPLPATGLSA